MSGNAKRRPGGNRAASEAFDGAAPHPTSPDASGTSGGGVRPLDWLRALHTDPVLDNRAVAPTALALMKYAPGAAKDRSGWVFFASGDTLAALARVSVPTIERGLRALRTAGFLELHRRGGGPYRRANEFRLTLPGHPSPVTDSGDGGDAPESPGQPSPVTDSPELASHQTSVGLPSNGARSPLTGDGPTEKYSTEEYSTEEVPPLPRTPQGVLALVPPAALPAPEPNSSSTPNHRPRAHASPHLAPHAITKEQQR